VPFAESSDFLVQGHGKLAICSRKISNPENFFIVRSFDDGSAIILQEVCSMKIF
jgi:hypothetical protein